MFEEQAGDEQAEWRPPLSTPDRAPDVLLAPARDSVLLLGEAAVAVLEDERDHPGATADVALLARIGTQVETALAERVDDVARPGAWALDGNVSLTGWVAAQTRLTNVMAGRVVRLGRGLRELAPTRSDLAAGVIRVEHAGHVLKGVQTLRDAFAEAQCGDPDDEDPGVDAPLIGADGEPLEPRVVLAELEEALLLAARNTDAVRLGVEVRKHVQALAPLPAARSAKALLARRRLRLSKDEDGLISGGMAYAPEEGEFLRGAIAAYRRTDHHAGDKRTPTQRDADALLALVRAGVEAGALPAQHRVRPHLLVLVPYHRWIGRPGAASVGISSGCPAGTCNSPGPGSGPGPGGPAGAVAPASLLDGEPLATATWQRLACDSRVTRIVLDPAGLPLDVGRTQRTVPPQIWLATVAQWRTCAAEGCDAAVERCEGHHVVPFSRGGDTSLANTVPFCTGSAGHHAQVHDLGRTVTLEDGRRVDGRGWVGPPDTPLRR